MESEIKRRIHLLLGMLKTPGIEFVVERPSDKAHGDYATNVAMVVFQNLTKAHASYFAQSIFVQRLVSGLDLLGGDVDDSRLNPRSIAEIIVDELKGTIPYIKKMEVAGSGFINFYLDRDFYKEKINEINSQADGWGRNEMFEEEEIIFEYTSPNLFKPLHVGNLVGNIVGESVSRLFEAGGAILHRVNYPSDIGLTVAKGVWGLTKTGGDPKDINQIGEAYRFGNEAYDKGGEEKEAIEAVNRALYRGDDEVLNTIRTQGIETSRSCLVELCRVLGTTFDIEIFESEVSDVGTKIVRTHIGNVFEESEGAVIFRGEKYGFHTRVFLNSQGLPTYEAKDVGNFALKNEAYPAWTQSFVVTGGEQREYFKVLICALREIFIDAKDKVIEHIPTGFLTLTTGKMSSRKGNVLTGESLLEEMKEEAKAKAEASRAKDISELTEMIAVGALKYQILRQSIGSNIVFDKEKALSFEGDSGPYLMYTHARISSMEGKAHEANMKANTAVVRDEPYAIEKLVYQFPEIVLKAQVERAPHHIVVFLTQLAGAFNAFYGQEKIVDTEDSYAPYKLAIAQAVRITLKNGLYLLGIKATDRM